MSVTITGKTVYGENVTPVFYKDFANQQSLSSVGIGPDISFSRASSATFVNSRGYIQLANNNVPRFDYDPNTLQCKGLLLEEGRTNRLNYTMTIGNTAVGYVNAGTGFVTLNYTTSPDGSQAATLFDQNGVSNNYTYYNGSPVVTLSPSTTYTYSIFVKKVDTDQFFLAIDENSFGGKRYQLSFQYTTMALVTSYSGPTNDGTIVGYGVTPYSNNWYRVYLAFKTSSVTVGGFIDMMTRFANPAGKHLLWGRQLEQNSNTSITASYPTSFIPTSASSVARSFDVAYVPLSALQWNDMPQTVVIEYYTPPVYTTQRRYLWNITDVNLNRYAVRVDSSNISPLFVVGDGTATSDVPVTANSQVLSAKNKYAFSLPFSNSTNHVYLNGVKYTPGGTRNYVNNIPSANLYIGNAGSDNSQLNAPLSKISYYNTNLRDFYLQQLTR